MVRLPPPQDTLLEWIEGLADGETIEAVVLGRLGGDDYGPAEDYNADRYRGYLSIPFGQILTFDQAREWLTVPFYSGLGSPGCPAVVAWTENWIISVDKYDGATSPFRIPRNPKAHMPVMPGG